MGRREIEIVHGAGDVEIAVGIEAVDEGRALVAQIALDLEIGVEAEAQRVAVLQGTAELALQRLLREIGDVRGHARHRQAARRHGLVQAIVAALPFGIGHDRLTADLVEGDVLRRMAGRRGDRHGGEDASRMARCPLQDLHAAHRPADHAEQVGDAEMVEQGGLGTHHVGDRHHREAQVPGLPVRRIEGERPGGAHAAAQHVAADHEVAVGVDDPARPDQAIPPAFLAGHRIGVGDKLVGGQRMADQHGVRLVGIEPAIGLVGDAVGAEFDAAIELERPVGAQDRGAASLQRLALGAGETVERRSVEGGLHVVLRARPAGCSPRKSPRP